jgi:hypothetical protein
VKRQLLLAVLVLAGCGGGGARNTPSQSPVVEAPLNSFAAARLIVMPTQSLRTGDAMGWAARANGRTFMSAVDSALEASMKDRGLTSWIGATELARTARRNPMYATNPSEIRAGDAVRYLERQRESEIPEPVASQLRTLISFHDGVRHALVPVEVRFEPGTAAGTGRAVLRIAVLDIRGSRLVFIGDIMGPDAPDFSPAIASDIARRFTDLVVPR